MGSPLAELPAVSADAFEVVYVESDGSKIRAPLSSCWMARFEESAQVRRFGSFRGKRSFAGLWWFSKTGDHVGFESWLERDRVMALDFDPSVAAVSAQPFRLEWQQSDVTRTHVPDFFARLVDGTGVVIDVRADDRIEPDDALVFEQTGRACRSVGWRFRRVGVFDPVRTANLRWLAGYRHPRCRNVDYALALGEVFAGPLPLMEGVRDVGDPIAVLPTLFHLLWRSELLADLDAAVLGASTLVCCGTAP